jgi:hypothetical protein
MNLARSTYYEEPTGQRIEDAVIVEMIGEICAEFPCYGYRRVIAQLRREVDTPRFRAFQWRMQAVEVCSSRPRSKSTLRRRGSELPRLTQVPRRCGSSDSARNGALTCGMS